MSEHATQGTIGWGAVLEVETVVAGVYEEIHECRTMAPGSSTADEVEMTHFGSPNRKKEFIQGLVDDGEATAELNWAPDIYLDHQQIRHDNADGTVRNYRILMPRVMETIKFSAFVKTLTPGLSPSGATTMAVTFRRSGETVEDNVIS